MNNVNVSSLPPCGTTLYVQVLLSAKTFLGLNLTPPACGIHSSAVTPRSNTIWPRVFKSYPVIRAIDLDVSLPMFLSSNCLLP